MVIVYYCGKMDLTKLPVAARNENLFHCRISTKNRGLLHKLFEKHLDLQSHMMYLG